ALLHVISQIQKILRSTIARCRRKISGGLISPGSVKAMLHHRQKLNMREAHTLHIFFFPAEDGIRYGHVTGVQTCALPIFTLLLDLSRHLPSLLCARRRAAPRKLFGWRELVQALGSLRARCCSSSVPFSAALPPYLR